MDLIGLLSPYPLWIKLLASVGVLCIVSAGIGMLFTSVPKKADPGGGGTVSVTSNNQKGGITANTVNTPKP